MLFRSATVNVWLDYGLIFGRLGLPQWGLEGAAIASVIAEACCTLFFLLFSRLGLDYKKYGLNRFRIADWRLLERVLNISSALFEKYPTPAAMAQADPKDIMKLIRTIGLYKTKTQRIIDQAKKLVEDFDGIVPEDDKLLQSLPGVGRKTANVVMADGFGHQRIAVDTHVFQVSNSVDRKSVV